MRPACHDTEPSADKDPDVIFGAAPTGEEGGEKAVKLWVSAADSTTPIWVAGFLTLLVAFAVMK